MKTHHPTTRRLLRRRAAAEQSAAPAPARDLDALHAPHTDATLRGAAALGVQRALGNQRVARELAAHGSATLSTTLQRKGGKAPAGKTVFEPLEKTTYDIQATTLQEALDAMKAAKDDEAAETTWEPNLSYETNSEGVVTKVTITVKITVEMPKWSGADDVSPKARAEWKRFYKALAAHELGHVRLVKKRLAGLAARLVGKSEADAQTAFSEATTTLQEKSDEYDEKTEHGRKAGTIINVDIE